jgi:hypothetical protein
MLKLIPAFREQDERLLICATNSIRALESRLFTPADIRHAISQTRGTLTPELVADFEQDITEYARI